MQTIRFVFVVDVGSQTWCVSLRFLRLCLGTAVALSKLYVGCIGGCPEGVSNLYHHLSMMARTQVEHYSRRGLDWVDVTGGMHLLPSCHAGGAKVGRALGKGQVDVARRANLRTQIST